MYVDTSRDALSGHLLFLFSLLYAPCVCLCVFFYRFRFFSLCTIYTINTIIAAWGEWVLSGFLFLFSFPSSADDHERDWPPRKKVLRSSFLGLATNQYAAEYKKQHKFGRGARGETPSRHNQAATACQRPG